MQMNFDIDDEVAMTLKQMKKKLKMNIGQFVNEAIKEKIKNSNKEK